LLDDVQGKKLEVVRGFELGMQIPDKKAWKSIGRKGFDDSQCVDACIQTLLPPCVSLFITGVVASGTEHRDSENVPGAPKSAPGTRLAD
jgi:hypothetical protein